MLLSMESMEIATSIELFMKMDMLRTLHIGANSWRLKVDTMTMVPKFVFLTGMEDTTNNSNMSQIEASVSDIQTRYWM